ncbi:MAG: tetratricopeptide repeat protein [Gammaproteobacteria bacterium]|nr:tetratricopeptide repeat protein [Gammaproteobacteria bacterium]MDH5728866.1 tetratricopeptide repeat protein [Gammaproteobacteria bacterium]
MSLQNYEAFDNDELLNLALDASRKEDFQKSLELLKAVIGQDDKNAKAHYLLGAVHAQLSLYDKAVDDLARALDIDPNLDSARFQLGLLFISSHRLDDAIQVWEKLDRLGDDNPLVLFKTGLVHLANDEYDQCIRLLEQGIEKNNILESLNNDMRKIMASAQSALDGTSSNTSDDATGVQRHVFLSSYENQDDKKND